MHVDPPLGLDGFVFEGKRDFQNFAGMHKDIVLGTRAYRFGSHAMASRWAMAMAYLQGTPKLRATGELDVVLLGR